MRLEEERVKVAESAVAAAPEEKQTVLDVEANEGSDAAAVALARRETETRKKQEAE